MSRGSVTTGTCPRCFTEQPLIWDGTIRPHGDFSADQWPVPDCPGSLHAPASLGFEVPREQLVAGLEALRQRLCGYTSPNHVPSTCDCKYGSSGSGEQTGCPELRQAIAHLGGVS